MCRVLSVCPILLLITAAGYGGATSPINSAHVREPDLNNYVNYVRNHFEVKRTYVQSEILQGRYYLNEGKFELVEQHSKSVLEKYPNNEDALDLLSKIEDYHSLIDAARTFEEFGNTPKAVEMVNYAIEISPSSKAAYELRAQLQSPRGQYIVASDNILARVSTILQGDNTEEYYRLSHLLYQTEHAQEAVRVIEKCLDVDPENKDCLSSYQKINEYFKRLSKSEKALEERRYKDCITEAAELLKYQDTWNVKPRNLLCRCYLKDHQPLKAVQSCTYVLSFRHDLEAYCNRAEALLESSLSSIRGVKHNTDLAMHDYTRVLEIDPLFERAVQGLSSAQRWSYVQRLILIPINLFEWLPISKLFS